MRLQKTLITAIAGAFAALAAVHAPLAAQRLGPQRQFLAIEPYYEYTRLDKGAAASTIDLSGYGARLWINGAPFHFPSNSAIALFASYTPAQQSLHGHAVYYGAQIDEFIVRRPFAGFLDPFLSVDAGGYYTASSAGIVAGTVLDRSSTRFVLAPGGGLRIPLPNRFELRGDVKDLIFLNDHRGPTGASKTTNSLLVKAGLGITF